MYICICISYVCIPVADFLHLFHLITPEVGHADPGRGANL